jgi:Golgi apyrase
VFLFACLVTFAVSFGLYSSVTHELPNDIDYGIIIDAGSSGSRIMIYSWQKPAVPESRHDLPILTTVYQKKVEPGISSFSQDSSGIPDYMKPLLDFAKSSIPIKKHLTTPIYLYATAGMRLIPISNQTNILEKTCRYVSSNYDFKINDCNENFKVISGETEGIYGWVTVNYLKGSLVVEDTSNEVDTFGFADMGGASAQIAFEPTQKMARQHNNDLSNIRLLLLDGTIKKFNIFVTTWLGFGANQARTRYVKLLMETQKENDENIPLNDPCLPGGLSHLDKGNDVSFIGTGDYDACLKMTTKLLNKDKKCSDDPCFFNGVHIPIENFANHRFLGVSEFWYSIHDVYNLGVFK